MAKATNAVVVCLGLTAACGGAVDAPEVNKAEAPGPKLMVLRADLIGGLGGPDGQIVLDTRKSETIYVFDESAGPLPWHRIELTCPNNSTMPIRQWIETQSFMKDRVEAGDRFSVSHRELEDQCLDCHLCPDGVWSCVDVCKHVPNGRGVYRPAEADLWAGLPYPPFPAGLPEPPPPPPDDPLDSPGSDPAGSGGTTPGGSGGAPSGGSPGGSGGTGGGGAGGGGGSGSGSGSGSGGGSNGGGHPTSGGGAPGGGLGGGGGGW